MKDSGLNRKRLKMTNKKILSTQCKQSRLISFKMQIV